MDEESIERAKNISESIVQMSTEVGISSLSARSILIVGRRSFLRILDGRLLQVHKIQDEDFQTKTQQIIHIHQVRQ